MKRVTVTLKVEGDGSMWDCTSDSGILDLSLTRTCAFESDVARMLLRLARMVDPNAVEKS